MKDIVQGSENKKLRGGESALVRTKLGVLLYDFFLKYVVLRTPHTFTFDIVLSRT